MPRRMMPVPLLRSYGYSDRDAKDLAKRLIEAHKEGVLKPLATFGERNPGENTADTRRDIVLGLMAFAGVKPVAGVKSPKVADYLKRMGLHVQEGKSQWAVLGRFLVTRNPRSIKRLMKAVNYKGPTDKKDVMIGRAFGYTEKSSASFGDVGKGRRKLRRQLRKGTEFPRELMFFEGKLSTLDDKELVDRGRRVEGLLKTVDALCGSHLRFAYFRDRFFIDFVKLIDPKEKVSPTEHEKTRSRMYRG